MEPDTKPAPIYCNDNVTQDPYLKKRCAQHSSLLPEVQLQIVAMVRNTQFGVKEEKEGRIIKRKDARGQNGINKLKYSEKKKELVDAVINTHSYRLEWREGFY